MLTSKDSKIELTFDEAENYIINNAKHICKRMTGLDSMIFLVKNL